MEGFGFGGNLLLLLLFKILHEGIFEDFARGVMRGVVEVPGKRTTIQDKLCRSDCLIDSLNRLLRRIAIRKTTFLRIRVFSGDRLIVIRTEQVLITRGWCVSEGIVGVKALRLG